MACGERPCRKWTRTGDSDEGMGIAVRNWGKLLRLVSVSLHEYFSSLAECVAVSGAGRTYSRSRTHQKSISDST